ncbi:uncharacterized protein LOC120345717 [Styela clava]
MGKAISPRPVSTAASNVCLNRPSPKSIKICRRNDEEESGISDLLAKLKSVVPTVSGTNVEELSSLEIMQHAIDYIYDLSSTLSEADEDDSLVSSKGKLIKRRLHKECYQDMVRFDADDRAQCTREEGELKIDKIREGNTVIRVCRDVQHQIKSHLHEAFIGVHLYEISYLTRRKIAVFIRTLFSFVYLMFVLKFH